MQKNANRPGYKKTKVGWIPEDWDASTFGSEFQIQLGKMLNPKATAGHSQHPYLANINVRWGSFDLSDIRTMSFSEQDKQKYSLKRGDLLVCEGGEIGRSAVWQDQLHPCYFQKALHRLRPLTINVDVRFTMHFLHEAFMSSRIKGLIGETSIAHFTRERFLTFPISKPPLLEQKAIAEVLECWDKAINSLVFLIGKKRLVMKGLLQELLSGKTRLKGFSKPWRQTRLDKIFCFIPSYAFSRELLTTENSPNSGIYNIHYGDIHATYAGTILDFTKERNVPIILSSGGIPAKIEILQDGDVVMTDASEDYEGVGACVELANVSGRTVTGGLHTFVLRDASGLTAAGFRGYLFKERTLANRLRKIASGVSVYSLSKTCLAEIAIALPPLDEQRAIAEILSAADAEIEALERKLALFKKQKRFLLNNLVTGTIRLPQFRRKGGRHD